MPFEKYLQAPGGQSNASQASYARHDNQHVLPSPVQLQIPHFIIGGPPVLAPGGGAEVLPAATLNDPWFTNSGFTRFSSNDNHVFSGSGQQLQDVVPGQNVSPDLSNCRPSTGQSYAYSFPPESHRPLVSSHQQNSLTYSTSPTSASTTSEAISSPSYPSSFGTLSSVPLLSLSTTPSFNLPVYSTSGFDLMSLLARVHTRPNPQVSLGPVDFSCSFVVVDVRRHDRPIIFCSPTFCRLTGYTEPEVIGRNCRFLQAPSGAVIKGERRKFTSDEEVSRMRKALHADKECQASLVNYRKDGTAFVNLVTIIPIHGGEHGLPHEENEVYYHIGFQVDLNEQPNAILQKLRDGSYMVNYSPPGPPPTYSMRERRGHASPQAVISKNLRAMLNDPVFVASIPTSTTTQPPPADKAETPPDPGQLLHTLLLTATPDFILVVSLKGLFLYVAPAVRRVLGYDPEELVGKSITDYCHPHDVVPLTRELKESSATTGQLSDTPLAHTAHPSRPRTVDLLFRALTNTGHYVWVECRGRLHVEPGKGRKAIILSGRARSMASMPWSDIVGGGGLNTSIRNTRALIKPDDDTVEVEVAETEREFWGSLSEDGVILAAGHGAKNVLGWRAEEMLGQLMTSFLAAGEDHPLNLLVTALGDMQNRRSGCRSEPKPVYCKLRRKDGTSTDVHLVLYQPEEGLHQESQSSTSPTPVAYMMPPSILPAPILFQVKLIDNLPSNIQASGTLCHESTTNIFEELQATKGTSWQYELQQLKIRNQAIADEIGLLEAQQLQADQRQQSQAQARQAHARQESQTPHQAVVDLYETRPTYDGNSYGLKRSWDSAQ